MSQYSSIASIYPRAMSVNSTDIQHTEACPTRRAGRLASHPGLRLALVLPATEPLAHTGQTPHRPAVARRAVTFGGVITQLD